MRRSTKPGSPGRIDRGRVDSISSDCCGSELTVPDSGDDLKKLSRPIWPPSQIRGSSIVLMSLREPDVRRVAKLLPCLNTDMDSLAGSVPTI